MIDSKNLNRIKGILSARKGAEIPKFTPGGIVEYLKQLGYNELTINLAISNLSKQHNGLITDEIILRLFFGGGAEEDYQQWQLLQANKPSETPIKTTTSTTQQSLPVDLSSTTSLNEITPDTKSLSFEVTVAGKKPTTPTSAVETAVLQTNANEQAVQQKLALATAQTTPITEPLPTPKLNAPAVQIEDFNEEIKSAGQKIIQEQLAKAALDAKTMQGMSIAGDVMSKGIQAIGGVFGALQAATDSETTKTVSGVYNGVAEAAKSFGPIGETVGTVMQTMGAAGDILQAMGGGTDLMTKTDQWMDSPLFSWNIGAINGFFGKESDSFGLDLNIMSQVGSSYGGTASDLAETADDAGKKYGLFSSKDRKKANEAIAKAKKTQNLMGNIADEASDQRLAALSMGELTGLAYQQMISGGYNLKYTYAAKQGGLLEWNPVIELEWEPTIEINWELPKFAEGGQVEINEELEWIPEFKVGGKTEESDIPEIEETNLKNVIPEGALHKNKHHMEHADGLTKKGIPVIDDDGDLQAEIEHSEIIFTLEVTKKLEEYYKIFYSEEATNKEKDLAAIDAGKLLVYQILENTDDRTGLIDICKEGGTLTLNKSYPYNKPIQKELNDKDYMKSVFKETLLELLTK